ncbi:MAG: PCI domain-containing protein [Promethearchaeota archaeon]
MTKCSICGRDIKNPKSPSHLKSKFHQKALIELVNQNENFFREIDKESEEFNQKYNKIFISIIVVLVIIFLYMIIFIITFFYKIILLILFCVIIFDVIKFLLVIKAKILKNIGGQGLEKFKEIEFSLWNYSLNENKYLELSKFYENNKNHYLKYLEMKQKRENILRIINGEETLARRISLIERLKLGQEALNSKDINEAGMNFWSCKNLLSRINFSIDTHKLIDEYLTYHIDNFSDYEIYKMHISDFQKNFKRHNYNAAFNYYLLANFIREKNKNINQFIDEKEEEKNKENFGVIVLYFVAKIKETVLTLSRKFSRVRISEIQEKCKVANEEFIIDVIKQMISNKEINAEYFSSSKSILFENKS